MAEKKTTPIVINGVEHAFEDMSEPQQMMVNHIADLERKIKSTQFNLDQLNVGKQAFIDMLTSDLNASKEDENAEEAEVVNG
jgi:predicted  nucleic acid-binding Zn-ribbon protein|tara:strand:+ start:314 stop:559 length:246 start_codon:yes stop_codon:yes gene_type:complete